MGYHPQFTPAYMQYPQMMAQGAPPGTPAASRYGAPNQHAGSAPPVTNRTPKQRVSVTIVDPNTHKKVELPHVATTSPAPHHNAPGSAAKVEVQKKPSRAITLKNPDTGEVKVISAGPKEGEEPEKKVEQKSEDTPAAPKEEPVQLATKVEKAPAKEAPKAKVEKPEVPAKEEKEAESLEEKKPEAKQVVDKEPVKEQKDEAKEVPSRDAVAEPKVEAKATEPVKEIEASTPAQTRAKREEPAPEPVAEVEKQQEAVKADTKVEQPAESILKADGQESEPPKEEPIRDDKQTDSDATPTPELEEGEIVEDNEETATPPPQAYKVKKPVARRSQSPASDESQGKETKASSDAANKQDTRPSMVRLQSFEGVKYPAAVPVPSERAATGRQQYQRDFLLQFANLVKEKPEGLDLGVFAGETSPRGDRRDSRGPGSRPLSMSRQGSFTDVRGGAPPPKTSEERFAQSLAAKHSGVGVQGVMSGVAPPPGARMSRSGSGGGRVPPMSRQGSARELSGPGGQGRSSRTSRGPPRQAPPEPAMEPVAPLVKSESAWAPAALKKTKKVVVDGEDKEKAEEETIYKKVKGLLNKLTIERFDSISDQILNVGMTRESILRGVIAHIFEKALDEPNFGAMYAQLCAKLSQELPKVQSWIELDAKNNTFRRVLLNRCQEEFEKGARWSESEEKLTEQRREARKRLDTMTNEEKLKIAEEDYERGKLKRRVLGNIRFIGELFIKGLITEKIMHACLMQLLKNVNDPEEEDIESLCKLMTTIGARLDHSKAKPHMDAYFHRIEELSVNKKLPARIRFMLLDLIDLRKEGWKAKNVAAGPKTIAEIRAEAERKAAEEEAKIRERNSRSSGGGRGLPTRDQQFRDRRGGGRGSQDSRTGGVAQVQSDGWVTQTSGKTSTQHRPGELAQFGQIKKADRTQITLGPGGGMGFGMGSKGWGKQKSKEGDIGGATMSRSSSASEGLGSATNMFSLLEGEGMDRKKSVDEGRKPAEKPVETKAKQPEVKKLSEAQAKTKFNGVVEEWFSLSDMNVSDWRLNVYYFMPSHDCVSFYRRLRSP